MIEYFLFVIGIVLLIKGADYLVEGSSSLAKHLKMSTLIVGLTIVAFGTSTPELIINIFSAIKGSTNIALGNIIGSNIANILLVLGITAIIRPIKVRSSTIWREIPFALLAAIVLFIVSNDIPIYKLNITALSRITGFILLSFFLLFLYYVYYSSKKSRSKLELKEIGIEKQKPHIIFFMIAGGLIALYFGGRWVVEGAIFISQRLGLSEFFISALIIAIGTSLPELATGISAAKKKETELAVGNSIGSNILNTFWILGITALIAPIAIPGFINFDMIFLIFITLLLFLSLFVGKRHELERWQGVSFVVLYFLYVIFLILRG